MTLFHFRSFIEIWQPETYYLTTQNAVKYPILVCPEIWEILEVKCMSRKQRLVDISFYKSIPVIQGDRAQTAPFQDKIIPS